MAVTWDVDAMLNTSPISVLILNQPIHCPPQLLLPIWNRGVARVTVDGGTDRWREYTERVAPAAAATATATAVRLPTGVTGDMDSIHPQTTQHFRSLGVPFTHTPDQDRTDFTKAFTVVDRYLADNDLRSNYIVCVCEHGGRLDQTMANLESLHLAELGGFEWRAVILAENTLTWLLAPGVHSILVPKSCTSRSLPCGLIPLSGPTTVTTKGLKWDLENGILKFGSLVSTSNTFTRTNIEVETNQNLVWTMQFS